MIQESKIESKGKVKKSPMIRSKRQKGKMFPGVQTFPKTHQKSVQCQTIIKEVRSMCTHV